MPRLFILTSLIALCPLVWGQEKEVPAEKQKKTREAKKEEKTESPSKMKKGSPDKKEKRMKEISVPEVRKEVAVQVYHPRSEDEYTVDRREELTKKVVGNGVVMENLTVMWKEVFREKPTTIVDEKITTRERIYSRLIRRLVPGEGSPYKERTLQLHYINNPIVIENRPRGASMYLKNGLDLSKTDSNLLRYQWNRLTPMDQLSLFLPPKKVAVGENWFVDLKKVLPGLGLSHSQISVKQSTGRAYLKKVYHRRSVQWGHIQVKVALEVLRHPQLPQVKGRLHLVVNIHLCIDGSTMSANWDAHSTYVAEGLVPSSRGKLAAKATLTWRGQQKIFHHTSPHSPLDNSSPTEKKDDTDATTVGSEGSSKVYLAQLAFGDGMGEVSLQLLSEEKSEKAKLLYQKVKKVVLWYKKLQEALENNYQTAAKGWAQKIIDLLEDESNTYRQRAQQILAK